MMRHICVGEREIGYELIRKKVKNINLRIHSDGRITVSASIKVPETVIDQFIISKSSFIFNALDRFGERRPQSVNYADGEVIPFFGEKLTIRRLKGDKRQVELREGELWIFLRDGDDDSAVQGVIEEFMRSELEARLRTIVPTLYGRFKSEPCVELSGVKIRKMRSRWGSCNCRGGVVTINLHLAEHSVSCLEFVVMHELCHLFHPDHSKDFYALLSSVMPDWKARREALNKRQ